MANVRRGNTWWIDATGALGSATSNVKTLLYSVVITPTSANAILKLQDNSSTAQDLVEFRAATSGDSKTFDFSRKPIVFPNGIKVATVTNCNAAVVVEGGGS